MRQLIVEIQDNDMRTLEEAARAAKGRPEELLTEELKGLAFISKTDSTVPVDQFVRYRVGNRHNTATKKSGKLSLLIQQGSGAQPHFLKLMKIGCQLAQQEHSGKIPAAIELPTEANDDTVQRERERRRAVLSATAGMWKGHKDARAEGVQYQAEARAE